MLKRGIYLRKNVTPFVILFLERDGSTYTVSMLSSHPEINVVYERFHVIKQKGEGAQEQLKWADSFFSPHLIGRQKAVGFKTKLVDVIDPEGFAKILHEKQCHIIHMQRRNMVKATISKINARRLHENTGNWNLYNESDRLEPLLVDLKLFDELLHEREQRESEMLAYVNQLQLPKLNVCYEDLLVNRDGELGRIFEFLNVKWFPVESKTKKNTKDDLRDVMQNYDEVRAHYAGTRYEDMFDEVLAS
jgi:LPS sulfotransferase NodH